MIRPLSIAHDFTVNHLFDAPNDFATVVADGAAIRGVGDRGDDAPVVVANRLIITKRKWKSGKRQEQNAK